MNLSITKKATAIYKVNSIILILLSILFSEARSQEMSSYCFDRSVSLREVQQSLSLLLLPKDIVERRVEDNCLDIFLSTDRVKLFEKFLSKRYDLKKDPRSESESKGKTDESSGLGNDTKCRLDLRTTKKTKVDSSNLKLGEKNVLNSSATTSDSVSIMEMLLGPGQPGELEAGDEKLKVTCRPLGTGEASLIFSYSDKNKASVNSHVQLKKGEWLNIASVIKELADQNKTIGVPQTEVSESTGKIETIYELKFK